MDQIIQKISEIEASASSVMENVSDRKAALSKEFEAKISEFDAGLEADTAQKLAALRAELEADLNTRLSKQEQEAQNALERLEQSYEAHHLEYARRIFQDLIKE